MAWFRHQQQVQQVLTASTASCCLLSSCFLSGASDFFAFTATAGLSSFFLASFLGLVEESIRAQVYFIHALSDATISGASILVISGLAGVSGTSTFFLRNFFNLWSWYWWQFRLRSFNWFRRRFGFCNFFCRFRLHFWCSAAVATS